MDKHFDFHMGQIVSLIGSGETGKVVARAEYATSEDSYLVRYKARDGRLVECWWGASALEPA